MTSLEHRLADGSSRAGVLRVLRQRGDLVRVEELAEAVNLSLSAVRFHLDRLIADGLVRTTKEPRLTPGRPRVMYQAVPEEAVDDAVVYRRLAALLADELAARGGPEAGQAAGRNWARQVVPPRDEDAGHSPGRPAPPRPGLPVGPSAPDSLADVVQVLEDGGFAPKVLDEGWTVELHRCPYAELMPAQSAVVCSVHQGLFQSIPELEGAQVGVRLDPAPELDRPCVLHFLR